MAWSASSLPHPWYQYTESLVWRYFWNVKWENILFNHEVWKNSVLIPHVYDWVWLKGSNLHDDHTSPEVEEWTFRKLAMFLVRYSEAVSLPPFLDINDNVTYERLDLGTIQDALWVWKSWSYLPQWPYTPSRHQDLTGFVITSIQTAMNVHILDLLQISFNGKQNDHKYIPAGG